MPSPAAPSVAHSPPPLPVAPVERNPFLPSNFPSPKSDAIPSLASPPTFTPAAPLPLPLAPPSLVSPTRAVEPQGTTSPQVTTPARVYLSDDLPDLLDGRARNRRALAVVVVVALVALLGTIVAAIASHYRPI